METFNKKVEVPAYLKLSKWLVWALYFFVVLGIVSLVLRFLLLLFNANTQAGFAQLVADISADYMQPFRGLFPSKELTSGAYVDVSALFAIVVYLFVLWGVHGLINFVQNKIDLTVAVQEKELAELKRQKELAAQRASQNSPRQVKKPNTTSTSR